MKKQESPGFSRGEQVKATPNMRQVREFIEQAFLAADDINAIEEGRQ